MSSPLFSVITIAKNAGQTIVPTVKSVVAQTFADFEYLIIDGKSTDETVALARKHSVPSTILISEPDHGIANAMNKGIQRSSGQILIHLNAGDSFAEPTVLQRVAEDFKRFQWPWAVGSCEQFDPETGTVRILRVHRFDYETLRRVDYIPHQSTFICRWVFDQFGFFDESFRISMDYEYWLRIGRQTSPRVLRFVVSRFELGGTSRNPLRNTKEDRRARTKNCRQPPATRWVFEAKQLVTRLAYRLAGVVLPQSAFDRLRSRRLYQALRRTLLVPSNQRAEPVFEVELRLAE